MFRSNEPRRVLQGVTLAILIPSVLFILALMLIALAAVLSPLFQFVITYFGGTSSWLHLHKAALVVFGVCLASFIYIGITQLLYIIPLLIILRRQQRFQLMKGLAAGTVIVALINFVFFILILTQSYD